MAERIFTVVILVLVVGFAATFLAGFIAMTITLWLQTLDELATRRRRRNQRRESNFSELLLPDRTFGIRLDEGHIQRGNRSGETSTPKPDIIPKPQPPGGRLTSPDGVPVGYRPNPSRPGANPPPRNP